MNVIRLGTANVADADPAVPVPVGVRANVMMFVVIIMVCGKMQFEPIWTPPNRVGG